MSEVDGRTDVSEQMSAVVIVSGLPASGKSSIGRRLAEVLSWPLIDKDHLLEALFEERGVGDQQWRQTLSREADEKLIHAALESDRCVLVSWWKRPKSRDASGTRTEWLLGHPGQIAEVYCACPVSTAANRFLLRTRHRGHLDHLRSATEVLAMFERGAPMFPLGVGELFQVDTSGQAEVGGVAREVSQYFDVPSAHLGRTTSELNGA